MASLATIPSEIKETLSKETLVRAHLLLYRHSIWHPFLGKCKKVVRKQWERVTQESTFEDDIAKTYFKLGFHDTSYIEIIIDYCVAKLNALLLDWILTNVKHDKEFQKKCISNALIQCSVVGNFELVKLCLLHGANVHCDSDSAVSMAAKYGHFEIVRLLLEYGCDIHTELDYPLCWASRNGHWNIVELLLDNGADINARDGCCLHWAAENGHTKVVSLLLDMGALIHSSDDYALRWSALRGHLPVVALLLSRGADVHASNDYALRNAVKLRRIEIVKLLLQYGADIHQEGDEALKWCDSHNDDEMRQILQSR